MQSLVLDSGELGSLEVPKLKNVADWTVHKKQDCADGEQVRLRELKIKNFRKIEHLVVAFPKGLSVIVGENNTGKTTIIDALRLILMPSRDFDTPRISEDDFRTGTDFAPIEISCTFCDTTDIEEAPKSPLFRLAVGWSAIRKYA